MELFKRISELLDDNCTLSINVAKKGERLIVSVLPGNSLVKDTAATSQIVPLNISGTGTELDEGFVDAIFEPVKRVTGLLVDMQSFEEGEEAAKQKSKMEAKKKSEEVEKKKQYLGYVELAKTNLAESKFRDALVCIEKAREFVGNDSESKSLDTLKAKVDSDSGIGSMFGGAEDKSDGKNVKLKGTPTAKPTAQETEDDYNEDSED